MTPLGRRVLPKVIFSARFVKLAKIQCVVDDIVFQTSH
jgi:hypothetical protein